MSAAEPRVIKNTTAIMVVPHVANFTVSHIHQAIGAFLAAYSLCVLLPPAAQGNRVISPGWHGQRSFRLFANAVILHRTPSMANSVQPAALCIFVGNRHNERCRIARSRCTRRGGVKSVLPPSMAAIFWRHHF